MSAASTQIAKDCVASIHYTLFNKQKEILDSSEGAEPLMYLHGHGQIVAGLESALAGKKVGDKLSVEVAPTDGYGEYQEALKLQVKRDQFPEGAPIEIGTTFELAGDDGHSMLARILEISGDSITMDANHPLAGEQLFFDVEIMAVRPATKEELEHGHAHGGDGHHH